MLRSLTLEGVGPAKKLSVEFGDRLNLITGDNGLGKSFLLDIAWWALTDTWSLSQPVRPRPDALNAWIASKLGNGNEASIAFNFSFQGWGGGGFPERLSDVVVFAKVDGGFSVWDPSRNGRDHTPLAQAPYLFDSKQVWTGIEQGGSWRCNGLYRDWASWQRENNDQFLQLTEVIKQLSPPNEQLSPGPLQRISSTDSQDYPTIRMPYGDLVPVIHASAAIRRILALSYLVVWVWQEHLLAARFRRQKPSNRFVFLIDEIEAHLHPSWQRRILPALLTVVESLTGGPTKPEIQIIATTHSPLVCVSVESQFNEETDRLLDMDLDPENGVKLESVPFHKLGTSENWLISRNFDMHSTRSESAEAILEQAGKLVEQDNATKEDFDALHQKLAAELPDTDSFWVIWRRLGEKRGWIE